jgi:enoyl-CoA hydratase/carnithine racemase
MTGAPIHSTLHDGGALEVGLEHPPVNALDRAFVDALARVVDRCEAPDVRAVAWRSRVPRIFLAGADLGFVVNGEPAELRAYVERLQALFARVERLAVPVVVGIDGACLGGGLELALCGDVRIVGDGATLGLPEAQLGILPGAGGTQRLVRAVGQGVARDLLLTGRRLDAGEAVACGVASRRTPAGLAGPAAVALAQELAAGSPQAMAAIKALALSASETGLQDGLDREVEAWVALRATANAQEGLEAFAERRPPRFA